MIPHPYITIRLLLVLALCGVGQVAFAQDAHYVATNSTPASPYTNWTDAANDIQSAIDVSTAGDTVWVSNGVYETGGTVVTGYLLTNRIAITTAITVRSANNDPTNTIIVGASNNGVRGYAAVRCAYMTNAASLIGFTLTNGYVVDYIGIGKFLKEALIETEGGGGEGGGLETKRDEIPRLEDRYQQVMAVFTACGITDITDIESCVDLLAEVKIRADFITKLRLFLVSLGIVLPLPEGNRYLRDAKILGFIAKVASNLYRDNQLNLLGVEKKVRQLIDEYISAQGVDPKIPPIDIMDAGFEENVKGKKSAKSRASEMLHAIRFHITIHLNEDPEHYKSLSQKLDAILQNLRDNWTELERVLIEFMHREVLQGREEAVSGINPKVQAPFFDVLKKAAESEAGAGVKLKPEDPVFPELVKLTVKMVGQIQAEICKVDFWRDPPSRQDLEKTVNDELRWCRVAGRRVFQNTSELATRIVDLAYHRRRFLVE